MCKEPTAEQLKALDELETDVVFWLQMSLAAIELAQDYVVPRTEAYNIEVYYDAAQVALMEKEKEVFGTSIHDPDEDEWVETW